MTFLIVAAAVTFLTGLFLFFAGDAVKKVSDQLNHVIFHLDEALCSARLATGLMLLIVGVFLVYTAFAHPSLWYLQIAGWLVILFGLLYVFIPSWLGNLSDWTDRIMLSTDELIFHTRRITGVVLVLISMYIVYSIFQIK